MSEASPTPMVSVITPLYNSSELIRKTLDSLVAQAYTDWECVLIDDGSTDDTEGVVKSYLGDPRFTFVQQANRGIAGARNTGIALAKGTWVCLLDHDDFWRPDKLEKQIRYALKHGCDIIGTDAIIVRGNERWLYGNGFPEATEAVQHSLTDSTVDVFAQLIKVDFLCASSVMIRRSLFEEQGLLDPTVVPADDYDMWLRCAPRARFGYVQEPLIEYQMHGANYSNDMARILEFTVRVLQRHRRRHLAERYRRRQFDESLAYHLTLFFRQVRSDTSVFRALVRTARLLRGGGASRLLRSTTWPPFAVRAKNSAIYRIGLLRTWKGRL